MRTNFLSTVSSTNQKLFDENISGKIPGYWMRFPSMAPQPFINYLNDIYQKNYSDAVTQNKPRIPLVVHQIWMGPELPKHLEPLVSAWQKLPPPWQYRLWTEKGIDALGLANKDLYKRAQSYAEKADIARYEILARFGGVYVDCDVELVRPEELKKLHTHYDFYAGLEQLSDQRTFSIGNSIIGSVPRHPVLEKMVTEMPAWHTLCKEYYEKERATGRKIEQWEPTCLRTGPGYLSAMFFKYAPEDQIHRNIIVPPDTFYPYDFTPDKPDIIARHRYDGSWLTTTSHGIKGFFPGIIRRIKALFGRKSTPSYYSKSR